MDINTVLAIIEIILLALTACLIPVLNMWFESKISKVKEELSCKYFPQAEAKYLTDKIDELAKSVNTMNQFLLENWSKR